MKKQLQDFLIPQLIAEDMYVLQRCIGRGSFGHIYEALEVKKNRQVCLKIIPYSRVQAENQQQDIIKNEVNILREIQHPNIIYFYNFIDEVNLVSITQENILCSIFVIELCQEKNLYQVIQTKPLTDVQKKKICVQLIEAIRYLHLGNIMHCDMKPSNVLLDQQNNAKLADFGLSRQASQTDIFLGSVGTPYSQAPEMYQLQYYDQRIDIWGLGVIIFYLFTGELPFPQQNVQALKNAIIDCRFDVNLIEDEEIKHLIQMMLVRQADRVFSEDLVIDDTFLKMKQELQSQSGFTEISQ